MQTAKEGVNGIKSNSTSRLIFTCPPVLFFFFFFGFRCCTSPGAQAWLADGDPRLSLRNVSSAVRKGNFELCEE
jgi:hypothetical protein